jgi:voltage-gated sodium channel
MSLVNSIFVDAMAADNNDGVLEKLSQIEKKLDKMHGEQDT